jgi:hypothetical protein
VLSTNADEVADELLDEFSDFEEDVEEEIDRALREAQDLARQRVPRDTGALARDISIDLEEDRIFNTLEYAPFVEFGTIYMEGTHYLGDSARDAFEASLQRLRS